MMILGSLRLRQMIWCLAVDKGSNSMDGFRRFYSTKDDLKKLRPMILKRIENRAKDYPIKAMIPMAHEVLRARNFVAHGISTLIKVFPVLTCRFCSEVFIGKPGHSIRTCSGYKRLMKNRLHEWVEGSLDDILVPVETFHLKNMFQGVIKHDERFDFDRVPAVVELCWQAGADPHDGDLQPSPELLRCETAATEKADVLSEDDIFFVARTTLKAWESLRSGVQRLLWAYPVKVCKYCSEVHVGPSGHLARLCGIFKYQTWRGTHLWKKATVDDLVPPKIVWRQRPQDAVLVDDGRDFYGHAPAVVELCMQAGCAVPSKYFSMMKIHGWTAPV